MKDRFDQRQEQGLYRGLHLSREESDWVNHYLRVADHVLFGERPAPRVVVVDDDWPQLPRRVVIAPKKVA